MTSTFPLWLRLLGALGTAGVTIAIAAAPRAQESALIGRWAVELPDCVNNRYVWQFADTSAAVLIDNTPIPSREPARYEGTADEVTVTLGATGATVMVWRFVGPDQIVRADGGVLSWRRCP